MADLNIHSIEEVWNGLSYRMVRHYHNEGNRRKVDSCKNCHQWMADYSPNKILGELYINEGD